MPLTQAHKEMVLQFNEDCLQLLAFAFFFPALEVMCRLLFCSCRCDSLEEEKCDNRYFAWYCCCLGRLPVLWLHSLIICFQRFSSLVVHPLCLGKGCWATQQVITIFLLLCSNRTHMQMSELLNAASCLFLFMSFSCRLMDHTMF